MHVDLNAGQKKNVKKFLITIAILELLERGIEKGCSLVKFNNHTIDRVLEVSSIDISEK
jgi:hypothetical protein